jgi:hypothetical protein
VRLMELMEMSCRRPGEAWSVPPIAAPAVAGEQVARPVKPCNAPATKFSVGRMNAIPVQQALPLQPVRDNVLEVLGPAYAKKLVRASAKKCLVDAAPGSRTAKASACQLFRGYRAASAPAAYASRMVLPPPLQSSLPAGWLAFTGRESNPLDRFERFQITFSFPFPGLILAPPR